MDQPTATILAALVGFVGGLVIATATYRQKSDELFYKALDFLGGGTQNRNLGIAAIELSWDNPRHRAVSVSLLIGSALYLLLESKQKDAAHELHNLEQIMDRVLRVESKNVSTLSQYMRLLEGILAAKSGGRDKGVAVPDDILEKWETEARFLAKKPATEPASSKSVGPAGDA